MRKRDSPPNVWVSFRVRFVADQTPGPQSIPAPSASRVFRAALFPVPGVRAAGRMIEVPWHPDGSTLERYAVNALGDDNDPTVAMAEEHLLWCAKCIDRLTTLDALNSRYERH